MAVYNGVDNQDNEFTGTLDDDQFYGGNGFIVNRFYGDAFRDLNAGDTGGDDFLIGGENTFINDMFGDAFALLVGATGGNDILIGGAGSSNHLYGDAYYNNGGTGGNDILIGGGVGSTNYLIGDAYYNNGGTGGNDRLVSAPGTTDHMYGDFAEILPGGVIGGQDTFAFAPGNGVDYIYDFHPGEDIIESDGFIVATQASAHLPPQFPNQAISKTLLSFSHLNIETVDNNSVIHLDHNNSITVVGVTGLTAADFHFVA